MELVSTMEINGEEREIADAYARGQIATNTQNIATNAEGIADLNNNLSQLEFGEVVGGKNLFKEYVNMDGYSISNEKYNGYPVIYKKGSWNGARANTILKAGKTYVVTLYAKGTGQIALYGSTSFTAPARTITSDWIRHGWVISVTSDTNELRVENVSDSGETYIACMQIEEGTTATDYEPYIPSVKMLAEEVSAQNDSLDGLKNDLSDCCKKSDITTNETLIGTFNGKNYYRKLFTGIGASGSSITVNVGEKIEIYNYYGRAYTYGQSGASDVKYPIPNKNYYIDSQNASETSFQLTIPTSSDTRKVDLVIEYTKVDE